MPSSASQVLTPHLPSFTEAASPSGALRPRSGALSMDPLLHAAHLMAVGLNRSEKEAKGSKREGEGGQAHGIYFTWTCLPRLLDRGWWKKGPQLLHLNSQLLTKCVTHRGSYSINAC